MPRGVGWMGAALAVAAVAIAACSPTPPPVPPPPDAGVDAGATPDAGDDAGIEPDAGADADAGAEPDAGEDAGEPDAGPVDAGCVFDAGTPPNLLRNPGFECGDPPEGWTTSTGAVLAREETTVRSGDAAARLSSPAGGVIMALFPASSPAQMVGIGRFCAAAWTNAAAGTTARLTIRATTGGGADDTNFNAPMDGTWQRLQISAQTTSFHDQVSVRVAMPNPAAGAVLYVDDVDLWESADGGCAR